MLYMISATVVGGIAGFVAGLFLGIVMAVIGEADHQSLRIGGMIVGYLAGLPFSFLLYRWSVTNYILNQIKQAPETTSPDESQWR